MYICQNPDGVYGTKKAAAPKSILAGRLDVQKEDTEQWMNMIGFHVFGPTASQFGGSLGKVSWFCPQSFSTTGFFKIWSVTGDFLINFSEGLHMFVYFVYNKYIVDICRPSKKSR